MRIEGTGPVGDPKKTDKKKKTGEADGSFSGLLDSTNNVETPNEAVTIQTTAPLDALIAAQEAENKAVIAQKALDWGDETLDDMSELQVALLDGSMTPQKAIEIRERITNQSDDIQDPELQSLLQEIETRAAVEAAKLDKTT